MMYICNINKTEMNPKEKAAELVKKFSQFAHWNDGASNNDANSQQCALIAVDEIINNSIPNMSDDPNPVIDDEIISHENYWHEVKREIEKP